MGAPVRALLPALTLLSACAAGHSNGFAVDLVLTPAAGIAAATLASVKSISVDVTGAETASVELASAMPFGADRQARVVYRPAVKTGTLSFSALALDADGTYLLHGTGDATLKEGATVDLTITMNDMVPPAPDYGAPADMAPPPAIAITPVGAKVGRNKTLTFSADQAVDWSVVETGGGTISAAGLYTAPAAIGVYHVRATLQSDATVSSDMAVEVTLSDILTLAGKSGGLGTADGTGAEARLSANIANVAIDTSGTLYIVDRDNRNVRKLTSAGVMTTIAGDPRAPAETVDGNGSAAHFNDPYGLALDGTGNIYISECNGNTIRRISATGDVTTLAGTAGVAGGGDDPVGVNARFSCPTGMVFVDSASALFVTDYNNHKIRKVTTTGATTTFAGPSDNAAGNAEGTGTTTPPRFDHPLSITFDGTNLYVADASNNTIRQIVLSSAVVTTIAGTIATAGMPGTPGSTDNATGTSATFNYPAGVSVAGGTIYVADNANNTVRTVGVAGAHPTSTLVGTAGMSGTADGTGSAARFTQLQGTAPLGNFLFAGSVYAIRSINLTSKVVTTTAGAVPSPGNADGDGATARFTGPADAATDASGAIFIADLNNHVIRKIVPTATSTGYTAVVTTVAGSPGMAGNAVGVGSVARLSGPSCIVRDGANFLVCDSGNSQLRKLDPSTGEISAIVGGVPSVRDVARGGDGLLYMTSNNAVYRYDEHAMSLRAIYGVPGLAGATDGFGAQARFRTTVGICAVGADSLYVTDIDGQTLRQLSISTGQVTTVAGTDGMHALTDDTGAAARFWNPQRCELGPDGMLYIADYSNHAIRRFDPATGKTTTVVGNGQSGLRQAMLPATLNGPAGLAFLPTGEMVVPSNVENAVQLVR